MNNKTRNYAILLSLFVSALIVANTVGAKLIDIQGVSITAGILAYPITFIVTDMISEVYGKKAARLTVLLGLISSLVAITLYTIAIYTPPSGFYEGQQAFQEVLGATPRLFIASMIAYFISQMLDVSIFHYVKSKTGKGKLWLRNNVSTFFSQLTDSVVFLLIAFAGIVPASDFMVMIIGYLAIKWAIAVVDTPIVYLGVHLLEKSNRKRGIFNEE